MTTSTFRDATRRNRRSDRELGLPVPQEFRKRAATDELRIDDLKSDVDAVAAAFASMRREPDKVDCVFLPLERVSALGISLEVEPGDLPDDEVNKAHRNLVSLTASDLGELAIAMLTAVDEDMFASRSKDEIRNMITDGIDGGRLRKDRVNEKLLKELRKRHQHSDRP